MEKGLAPELGAVRVLEEKCAVTEPDFEAAIQIHRPRIFRFIAASLRDRESAENLTHDCLMRAYKARDQFRGDASMATWLTHIAANLVRSHESSGRLKVWRKSLHRARDLRDVSDSIPDGSCSPEALVLAKGRIARIWGAVGRLSERQRTVFLLRFVEEMELLEIAAVTGMKEGTVKAHLFRALHSMRGVLEANS